MARVSLGVILPGKPDCIQKRNPFIKVLGFICKYSWIAGMLGILVCFAMTFGSGDWETYSFGGFRCLGAGVVMFLVSLVWDEKCRCAYCHHFFTLHRISEDKFISSSESSISRSTYDTDSGIVMDSDGNSSLFTAIRTGREYGTETTKTYTHNVRCRCCGAVCKVETSKTTQRY